MFGFRHLGLLILVGGHRIMRSTATPEICDILRRVEISVIPCREVLEQSRDPDRPDIVSWKRSRLRERSRLGSRHCHTDRSPHPAHDSLRLGDFLCFPELVSLICPRDSNSKSVIWES